MPGDSWCEGFAFTMKNLNYQLIFVIYFSVLRDIEMRVFQMVRVVYQEWLRQAIQQYGAFHTILHSSNTLSSVRRLLKRVSYMLFFRDSGRQNFCNHDPLFLLFVNCARGPPSQCNPLNGNGYTLNILKPSGSDT